MPSSNLNARLSFDQGKAAYTNNKYDDACNYFRAAVEADPRFTEAHRYLAESYEKQGFGHRAKKAWETLLRVTTDPAEKADIEARLSKAGREE